MSTSSKSSKIFQQKAQLRTLLRQLIKDLTPENKHIQSQKVTSHLLNDNARFKAAKHIGIFLTKQNDVNTIPLIEAIIENPAIFADKHLYAPHIQLNAKNDKSPEIEFFQLKNLFSYHDPLMNRDKLVIRESLVKVDPSVFDLMLVPGLGFDSNSTTGRISRIGRGKGYYDDLLRQLNKCYTIGVGFNEQFFPFNEMLKGVEIPVDEKMDVDLDEFLCAKIIK